MILHTAEDTAPIGKANPLPQLVRGYSRSNIATQTTTQVKTGAGFVHTVSLLNSVNATIEMYDNTGASGTSLGIIAASTAAQTFTLDCEFTTGLCIKTNGASNITVSYI